MQAGGIDTTTATQAAGRTGDPVRAVRVLLATPRILNMYPPGHQRAEAQFDELARLMNELAATGPDGTRFSVHRMKIRINGEAWENSHELATALAIKLRRRRIRALTVRPGITRGELGALVELLAADHREIERRGGFGALLPDHRHIELEEAGDESPESTGLDLPRNVAEAMEGCFTRATTMARLERLRQSFSELAPDGGDEVLDRIIAEFFRRPVWHNRLPDRIREAFKRFLGKVEQALFPAGETEDPLDSIRKAVEGIAPEDLVDRGEVPVIPPPLRAEADELVKDLDRDLPPAGAAKSLREEVAQHDPDENALKILVELMVTARHRVEYEQRRETFLAALADRRYSTPSIARMLRYVVTTLKRSPYEDRNRFVTAVLDATDDEEAYILFLASLTRVPHVADGVLALIGARVNPFPLLVRLLRAPVLATFRHRIAQRLTDAARIKPDALLRWARSDMGSFFLPEVFEPLFARGTELLAGICIEIFAEGSPQHRARLIARLRRDRTESALRLLVLGLRDSHSQRDPGLIDALADFQHPLAVGALREVIHRNNVERALSTDEVTTALRGLARMGTEDSSAFLWEVVERRAWLLPLYRRELRSLALRILESTSR